jgi:hypothetical protein
MRIERKAVGADAEAEAVAIIAAPAIVARLAQAFELAEAKGIPIASVRLDVMRDRRGCRHAFAQARGAQGRDAQLMPGSASPSLQRIPRAPGCIFGVLFTPGHLVVLVLVLDRGGPSCQPPSRSVKRRQAGKRGSSHGARITHRPQGRRCTAKRLGNVLIRHK